MAQIDVPTLQPARGCNCSECPFYSRNPGAPEPVCSGPNSDDSYAGYSSGDTMAAGPIRFSDRDDMAVWMADVGGTFAFDDITFTNQMPKGLPRYIPFADGDTMDAFHRSITWPAYALGFRRVMSAYTYKLRPRWRQRLPHDILGLKEGQLAILSCYGADPLVEGFWTNRHKNNLLNAIAAHNWDLVLAPNYSIYGNHPRPEHLLNIRRNLLIAQEMSEAGINAVPNVYWFRLEDLERTVDWIRDVEPGLIATNAQTCRTDFDWNDLFVSGLIYLSESIEAMGLATKIIVVGPGSPRRIRQLDELLGDRLILMNASALQFARKGKILDPSTGRERQIGCMAADGFALNVRYYASLLNGTVPYPVGSPERTEDESFAIDTADGSTQMALALQ
jgi:hypothetical protein